MTKKNSPTFELKSTQRAAYRRGGLVFPAGVTLTKSIKDLSKKQWQALEGDPRIVITVVQANKPALKKTPAKTPGKNVAPKKPAKSQTTPAIKEGAEQGTEQKDAEQTASEKEAGNKK